MAQKGTRVALYGNRATSAVGRACGNPLSKGLMGDAAHVAILAKSAVVPTFDRRLEPRPQRVLVVDDYADLRALWRVWLSMWGFDVSEAADGRVATEVALHDRPRLVLMDLSMPVMDGLSAVQRLRSDPRTADVTVIGVTAHGRTHPAVGEFQAACDLLLEKPIEPETLLDHMRRALKTAASKRS
jgi:CheY-like chemotaxis protein